MWEMWEMWLCGVCRLQDQNKFPSLTFHFCLSVCLFDLFRQHSFNLSRLATYTPPNMQIQQAIIIIMLTAVISIFVGMVSMSVYPPTEDAMTDRLHKLSRTVLFGFIMIPWVVIVCITDLYITQGTILEDVTQSLNCQTSSSGST